jgi:hypothetical protein
MNASTEYSYCNSQTNPVITENCNAKDKLYDTNNTRWINRNECSEKEQTERMYEDYSCLVSQCVPSMQSQWRDTGNRRNKAVGTYCGSARDCHESFCNGFFAEMYPADGHDSCDGSGNCRTYSCNYQSKSCSDDDTFDGINSLTCNAECDQNSDCQETECDSLDRCVGLDYYDYENVTNTCLSSCACSTNACSSPTIYPYDNRCNVCEVDNDCNYLDADYCIGTTLTHDEGKCVNNRCERAEETVEDCGARHIIMNTCGLMVWSCSEELNEVVCVAVDIQPQQDLCQDNTECNSVTFRCV